MNSKGYKKDFPVYQKYPDLVYLDNAATSQRPQLVIDAVNEYYANENANPFRGIYELSDISTKAYENARETVRGFIGAKSISEIIFTRNTTESLNLIAYTYGRDNIDKGDEILVCISEHHSDLLPWQRLAHNTGAVLKYLECSESGEYSVQDLKNALTPHTRLFAIAQVSNVFGQTNLIREFTDICHSNGTVVVCDGAQSVSHMPVDVKDLGVDFFAFSGHKMYAPMGIGVLYGREDLLEKMSPFLYGGEMIEYVTRENATYAQLPHKFEAGTVNVGGAVGLGAAIKYISGIGFDVIQERERQLTLMAFEKMQEIPHVRIVGSPDPQKHHGLITFTLEGVHPHDVGAVFDADGIAIRAGHHCAQPLHQYLKIQSTARMSLAFYNDEKDIESFICTLKTIRRRMGYDR